MPLPPLALAYHGLGDIPIARDPHHLAVRPDDLRRQIALVKRWGYELVTFGELATRVGEGEGAGAAALTFDDGLVETLTALVPILREADAPATVFAVSSWLGKQHRSAPWTRVVTEDELRELHALGIEIGGHTETHPDLTLLSLEDARDELRRGREQLEAVLGAPVDVAAYPYGHANAETRQAACEAGFRAACRTLGEGAWDDPFDLPRQAMENRCSLLGLRLKRGGLYEPLMRLRLARGVRRMSRRLR